MDLKILMLLNILWEAYEIMKLRTTCHQQFSVHYLKNYIELGFSQIKEQQGAAQCMFTTRYKVAVHNLTITF